MFTIYIKKHNYYMTIVTISSNAIFNVRMNHTWFTSEITMCEIFNESRIFNESHWNRYVSCIHNVSYIITYLVYIKLNKILIY